MFTLKPLYRAKRSSNKTYDDLAEETGITRANICKIIRGKQARVDLKSISKLCKALGVEEKELIVK